ncbi:MAG: beta-ketoacyl-[acyl-carrier-protein] synthase II, partial [Bdellovibrionales bacterium]|nr:beta-ketoacyl-[acyl-carrier-protein] synthase II [Bdellovibrionales bacterium]
MVKRRVVITGLGIVCPVGNDIDSAWKALLAGESGVREIQTFDASAFSSRIAGEVKGFDAQQYFDVKEIRKQDLFSQYAVACALQAWEDARLGESSLPQERMGCVLGVGVGGLGTIEVNHEAYLKNGPRRISPFLIPKMISNLAPGNIAIRLGLKGVNFTITSACTSATHAIGESYRMIASGLQDCIFTGGAESTVTPVGMGGFCAMKALSTRNEEPTKASRPFDKDRDGFVLGEGASVIVLEDLESAQKRGAKI